MADTVEQYMQDMVPELDDLRRKSIFSEDEIRHIVRRRRDFEYSLQRKPGKQQDYLNYVRYEIAMESLRQRRSRALRWRKKSVSDYSGVRRIHQILTRATLRFKADLRLWYQHVDFCLRSGSSTVLQRVLMKAVKFHPKEASLWLLAADRELRQGHVDAARKLLMRALRCLPKSVKVLSEFLRLEVGVAGQLLVAREMAQETQETEVKDEAKDVWAPTKLLFQRGLSKLAGKAESTAKFLVEALALNHSAASKWSSSEGFQEWSEALRLAALQRRPGLAEKTEEDSIMWTEVSDEAAVGIWEVWWKQELAAGSRWPELVPSIASCDLAAVLLRAIQAVLPVADDAGTALATLAQADAAAADPDIALVILQELSASSAGQAKGVLDSLLQRAASRHPKHLRLAMLTGDVEKVLSLLPHLSNISAQDAACFLSLKNNKGAVSMEELEQLLRALEPGQNLSVVLLAVLSHAAQEGPASLQRSFQQVRKFAEKLWDVPQLRVQLLSALLQLELRTEMVQVKDICKHFEDLLSTVGPSSRDATDVWLRYLDFVQGVTCGLSGQASQVPRPNDLHLRALRSVQDQEFYREKAQRILQGLEIH